MSKNRIYPRVGDVHNVRPQGRCIKCNEPRANARVAIQVNIFRGDDVVVKIHRDCLKPLSNNDVIELAKGLGMI